MKANFSGPLYEWNTVITIDLSFVICTATFSFILQRNVFIGHSFYIYSVYFCLLPVFHWQATIMGPVSSLLCYYISSVLLLKGVVCLVCCPTFVN
jgi:hypothetical protein